MMMVLMMLAVGNENDDVNMVLIFVNMYRIAYSVTGFGDSVMTIMLTIMVADIDIK